MKSWCAFDRSLFLRMLAIHQRCWLVGLFCFSGVAVGEVRVDWRPIPERIEGRYGFKSVTGNRGIQWTNHLSDDSKMRNRILENGSGVALGDVDGDGRCDVYLAGLEGENALFLNRGGWRFERAADAAGAACSGQFSSGVLLVDVNGDGAQDLLVSAIDRPVRLFLNDRLGRFQEVQDSGLSQQVGGTSISCADVDGDGDIDLYVCHYRERMVKDEALQLNMRREEGLWVLPPELEARFISTRNLDGRGILLEQGFVDHLYLNDGEGRFVVVEWGGGFFRDEGGAVLGAPPRDWSLSASFADLNDDGHPDLYVCGDFISPDRLWLNQGGKGFQAADRLSLSRTSWSSMCVGWSDIDLDGDWDFFVGDMLSRDRQKRHYQRANHTANAWTDWAFEQRSQTMGNTLFVNRGDQTFAELGRFAGLSASEWTWNCLWLDVDRDGIEDLLVTNGHPHDSLDSDWTRRIGAMLSEDPTARLQLPSLNTPNLAFRNGGDLSFREVGSEWGFNAVTYGQGVAMGDLDGDGDQDIVVNALNSGIELYENTGVGALVAVKLESEIRGGSVIGSKLVLSDGERSQIRELRSGGRYLSGDDSLVTFGTGESSGPLELTIRWPDGETSDGIEVFSNSIVEITRHGSSNATEPTGAQRVHSAEGRFEDVTASVNAVHQDLPFDDTRVQPMLTQQLSVLGMGLGWVDVDRNGWDDLVLGAGNSGIVDVFQNVRGQRWLPKPMKILGAGHGDHTALSLIGSGKFMVGVSGYELEEGFRSSLRILGHSAPVISIEDLKPVRTDGIGPVTMGDVDRDGDLDVFVGGRHVRGRFPQAASSVLLLNDGGHYSIDESHQAVFQGLGMVSGGLFVHLNDDPWIDLALALEWGAIKVFLNHSGKLTDESEALGCSEWTGLWQSIGVGDFNGDGRGDLIAGNWGKNRLTKPSSGHPLRLYFGESENPPRHIQIEAAYDATIGDYSPVMSRDRLAEVFPEIVSHFPDYRSFGSASIDAVLLSLTPQFRFVEARTLESMVFLNLPSGFVGIPLPWAAQISPVFGIGVADLDGDANEDVFVSQNFYGTELETAPFDAGLGCLLLGRGDGSFDPIEPDESRLKVLGSGRGVAVGDFDRDRRWDLVVGRRGRSAKVFRNRNARRGVTVGLIGGEKNRDGIGARARLQGEGGLGPARFLSSGSGDGAQDSVRPILYTNGTVEAVWVKWPSGDETMTPIPANTASVLIRRTGEIAELKQ